MPRPSPFTGKADSPYLSVLLASDHARYRNAAIPNLPYARDSAVSAAKQFIAWFKPDMIITGTRMNAMSIIERITGSS